MSKVSIKILTFNHFAAAAAPAVHLILWRALCQALKKEPHRHARAIPHMLEYWASLISAMARYQPGAPWLSLAALWFICLHHPVGRQVQSRDNLRISKLLAQLSPQFFRAYNTTFQALPVGSKSPSPEGSLSLHHTWVQKQPGWQLDFRHAISSRTFQWHLWLAVAATAAKEWEQKGGVSPACGCVVPAEHAAWESEMEGVDTSSWNWPTNLQDLVAALTVRYLIQPSETLTVSWMTVLRKIREMEARAAAKRAAAGSSSSSSSSGPSSSGNTSSSSGTGTGAGASSSSSSGGGATGGGSVEGTARAMLSSPAFKGWSVSDMVDVSRGETPSSTPCRKGLGGDGSCSCGRCAYLSYMEDFMVNKGKAKKDQSQEGASSSSSGQCNAVEPAAAVTTTARGDSKDGADRADGQVFGDGGKPPMLEPPGVFWLLLNPLKESQAWMGGLPPAVGSAGAAAWHPLAMLVELLLLSWPTDKEEPGKQQVRWQQCEAVQEAGGELGLLGGGKQEGGSRRHQSKEAVAGGDAGDGGSDEQQLDQGSKAKQLGEGLEAPGKGQQGLKGSKDAKQDGADKGSHNKQRRDAYEQPLTEDNSKLAACWDGLVVLAAMLQQSPLDVRQQFMRERGTQLLQLLYRAMMEEEKYGGRGVTGRLRLLAGTLDLGFVGDTSALPSVADVGELKVQNTTAGQAKGEDVQQQQLPGGAAATAGGSGDAGKGGDKLAASSAATAGKGSTNGSDARKVTGAGAGAGAGQTAAGAAGKVESERGVSRGGEASTAGAGAAAGAGGDGEVGGHVVLGSWVQEVSAAQIVLLVLQSVLLRAPKESLVNLETVKGGRYMRIGAGELVVPMYCSCKCY
jgi:hypothetical protein